ncbi:PLDc_N domain-containing protein [Labedella populi]|uniref:PLDc_N domain-containing protein n=1 Tax=Labedella populi TaxID=2498850 RepID=A0A3S4E208_9MICO|nr:PLD nuclease N-terminal domain-containing protein [Labedella populi]RWZ61557.1 PLDc_N domain-containing protein [Labedella populi]
MYLLLSAVGFLVLLGALIDIITRPDDQVRYLPKLVWVFLVILLPLVGSIIWFTVGREWGAATENVSFGDRRRWDRTAPAPAPPAAPARPQRVLSTEEQLAALEREAEFYEKQARIKRLESQLDDKRATDDA